MHKLGNTSRRLFIACCACTLLAGIAAEARGVTNPVMGTAVGQMYPDFRLPRLDGTFGRLSDFRGKKVLLVHFASW